VPLCSHVIQTRWHVCAPDADQDRRQQQRCPFANDEGDDHRLPEAESQEVESPQAVAADTAGGGTLPARSDAVERTSYTFRSTPPSHTSPSCVSGRRAASSEPPLLASPPSATFQGLGNPPAAKPKPKPKPLVCKKGYVKRTVKLAHHKTKIVCVKRKPAHSTQRSSETTRAFPAR